MQLNILGGSYAQKYLNNNSQRTVNWYCVLTEQDDEEESKSQLALYPFPGQSKWVTLPGRYFRNLYVAKTALYNRMFAIVDNVLYEVFANQSYNTIGTMSSLGIGACKVYMTTNANNQVGIFSKAGSYYFDMVANTLNPITSASFLGSVDTATYGDGYTVVVCNGVVQFNVASALQTWNTLNTYIPSFTTAPCMATVSWKEYLYNFTNYSIEIYLNDGTTPWSRLPRSTIMVGLKAKESLASYNDGFLFLGETQEGEMGVFYFDGFNSCSPISDTAITARLRTIKDDIKESYAYIQYTKTGHIFYRLTVPALKTTFVFDTTTKMWVEQQSKQPFQGPAGEDVYREFRGRFHATFKGMNFFGDLYSGKIFLEDDTIFTEDGNTIQRIRQSQTYCEEFKNISVTEFELDCNTGYATNSSPNIQLYLSVDGGNTFRDPSPILLGALGNYTYRARIFKLGTGRNWVVKLVYTDPGDLMLQNCIVHGVTGMN